MIWHRKWLVTAVSCAFLLVNFAKLAYGEWDEFA